MKYIFLLILLPALMFAQGGWDNSKWEKMDFYDNGQKLEDGNRLIYDIQCFENGNCYAVGSLESLYPEVFKYDSTKGVWDRIYNGYWDFFGNTPIDKMPPLAWFENPKGCNFISDSTFFIYFAYHPVFGVFNFRTEKFVPIYYQPAYNLINAVLADNGYGIAAIGNFVYTTKNYWNRYTYKDIQFPSSAFRTPIEVIRDTIFALADYDHGKCYLTTSEDGTVWERFYVGDFYPLNIYFMNSEIGFISGSMLNDSGGIEFNAIYKTIDGGKNWYLVLKQSNPPGPGSVGTFGIYDLLMLNDKYGIATSYARTIYTTDDYGETWNIQKLDKALPYPSYSSLFEDNERCYMTLPNQGILSYDLNLLGITSVPIYKYKPLSVYPNPVKNVLNIGSDNSIQGIYNLKLFSADSKLIINKKVYIDNGFKFDLDIPTGTYYLLLEGDNYFYSKIVKE